MKLWHVKVARDENLMNCIKEYEVQYKDDYDSAMVEDSERMKLFAECGAGAHFVFFSVICVADFSDGDDFADEDVFFTFPDEDGDDDEFNAPLNEEL